MGFLQNLFKKWRDKKEVTELHEAMGEKSIPYVPLEKKKTISSAKDRREAMTSPFGRKNIEKRKKRMGDREEDSHLNLKMKDDNMIEDVVLVKGIVTSGPGADWDMDTHDEWEEEQLEKLFKQHYPTKKLKWKGKDTKAYAAFKKEMVGQ